ncbi:MAG: NAD(P)H-quinone oxidoreductase [Polyangiaceae bacterium]
MRVVAIVPSTQDPTSPGGELAIVERPDPEPAAGHVRIHVEFAGVNRADILQRMGLYPAPPGAPADIPGLEYAGVVDRVGDGVTALRVGDRVFGLVPGGAYAEYAIVHEREAARLPDSLPMEVAAAVPEAFVTAYDALVLRGGLRPGERVLVHAAGSGVGTAGIQVAKALGCHVTGTSRTPDKLERARALGLDVGLVAKTASELERALDSAGPFDVVLDLVGGAYVGATLPAMATKGRLVVVGLTGGAHSDLNLAVLLRKRLAVVGTVLRSRPLEEKIQAADILRRTLSPWLARQMIRPVVETTFPLADVAAAHRLLEDNSTFGKVLLHAR